MSNINKNPEFLLEIRNLKTHFFTENGIIKAVDGINLRIKRGEIFGLVGESGSGKTITALSIMRLLPIKGNIVEGEIIFNGENLLNKSNKEMRNIRGNKISMIFQNPTSSLNPVLTIGEQIAEVIRLHQGLDNKNAMSKAIEMLKLVEIPSPETRIYDYPHQLSGGMKQRVMIAIALSCNPLLLIADEPTTSLDVTIGAQILELMKKLVKHAKPEGFSCSDKFPEEEFIVNSNSSLLLITHDFGILAETCDRVAVMKEGKIVEENTVKDIFKNPTHPYTQKLLDCLLY